MGKKVTMQDVADKLGVSKVTVSKALRGSSDISESMREKIMVSAEEMGYLYNSIGRALRDSKTYSVGIITSEKYFGSDDYFYVDLYKHLSDQLESKSYTVMFHILSVENETSLSVPRMVLEQKIDGLIILGQLSREYLDKILAYSFPTVFLDFYCDKYDIDSIITDNFFATYELTNMLIEQGHKKIAYVGNLNLTSSIQDRYLGYCKSMLEYRLPLKWEWIISDRTDTNQWIDIDLPDDMPTAFVCNCDKTAYKVIEKLKKAGYRVPEDCSVVGFDDSAHARMSIPKITTVRVNLEEMSKAVIKTIIKKISSEAHSNGRILIKGKIIKRNSVSKTI